MVLKLIKKEFNPKEDTIKKNQKYFDEELIAPCGNNCKNCILRSERRVKLAKLFKESLEELPLDLFEKIMPIFKDIKKVMAFLEDFSIMYPTQICTVSKENPCGNPSCWIRLCVQEKGFRTCSECGRNVSCSKLGILKSLRGLDKKELIGRKI